MKQIIHNPVFPLQSDYQGTYGSPEPGSISAVQHPSSADPGPVDPASPDTLLTDHSRIRISSHRRCPHCSPCKQNLLLSRANVIDKY